MHDSTQDLPLKMEMKKIGTNYAEKSLSNDEINQSKKHKTQINRFKELRQKHLTKANLIFS
jgi:hypothetical protein